MSRDAKADKGKTKHEQDTVSPLQSARSQGQETVLLTPKSGRSLKHSDAPTPKASPRDVLRDNQASAKTRSTPLTVDVLRAELTRHGSDVHSMLHTFAKDELNRELQLFRESVQRDFMESLRKEFRNPSLRKGSLGSHEGYQGVSNGSVDVFDFSNLRSPLDENHISSGTGSHLIGQDLLAGAYGVSNVSADAGAGGRPSLSKRFTRKSFQIKPPAKIRDGRRPSAASSVASSFLEDVKESMPSDLTTRLCGVHKKNELNMNELHVSSGRASTLTLSVTKPQVPPPTESRASIKMASKIATESGYTRVSNVPADSAQSALAMRRRSTLMAGLGDDEPRPFFGRIADMVLTESFDYFSGILILANGCVIGIEADCMAKQWTTKATPVFANINHAFNFMFATELLLRAIAYGEDFWSYLTQNLIDCIVITFSMMDELMSIAFPDFGKIEGNLSVLRIVRVLRLVRILRLARVMHLVGELRTLIVSIFDSLRALFWTMILISLITYTFAVFLTEIVTEHKISYLEKRDQPPEVVEMEEALLGYFGSLPMTVLTLYQTISEGMSWGYMVIPLIHQCGPWYAMLFVSYVSCCILALMNVVTSVFVTSAMKNAEADSKQNLARAMTTFFEEADADGSGSISWDEFQARLDTPRMQWFLREIDMHPDQARALFQLLDSEGVMDVDIEDIVNGCMRLHGPAMAIDLTTLTRMQESNWTVFWKADERNRKGLSDIKAALGLPLDE
eukprot:TRINITY_DN10384_c0_g1_i1.p1 TRINITY_DN10384_c0_g1~~TRINITY_DN10384_c0_g1_i1.p1  ORF type:complete len:774 (+),score=129.05 TRINITY_DN10384_c0_g1_i1:116-2323(+)